MRESENHYNIGLVGHFLAFNSKPTISIWKILGNHLSPCVIKQRERANYEWFKYHIPSAGQGQSQHWGPAHQLGQVTGTSQSTTARSVRLRCWQMLFSLYFSFCVQLENLAFGFLMNIQRFDLHAGDNAYQNHARQSFSLKRQIISICRTHKASPWSTKWLANPCIGHLVLESFSFPIIPLYSKSSPALASLRKPVFVELKKNVCEERGIEESWGKEWSTAWLVCRTHTLQRKVQHSL